ncbi:hypothetical protein [Ketobacter sp.]|uniref:hypothetical protein n=1 Tax=Ketobacter sp. TaxID=2083498 RepID=UPI0025C658AE|nr:hypothetical protein [Ketobacter sp.]
MQAFNELFGRIFEIDSGLHVLIWLLFVSGFTAAFIPAFRKPAKIVFTAGMLPMVFSLGVLLFASVLGAGFSRSWEAVQNEILPGFLVGLGLLTALVIGLLWYWLGRSQAREKAVFIAYGSVATALYAVAPVNVCEAAYDFRLSWGAQCLSNHYREGPNANSIKALEYRHQAARWGDADIAFFLYQTDYAEHRQQWLELAASQGHLDARYKLFYPKPNAPIQDMQRMAEFANLGQVDAQYHYGYWLLNQDDPVQGEAMLLNAAHNGSILAQRALAEEYMGIGILGKRDVERSHHWRDQSNGLYQKITRESSGDLRFYSDYLPEHYQQQNLWNTHFQMITSQAASGFANEGGAQYLIGRRLLQNENGQKRGLEWLKNAAKNGNREASQMLHQHFRKGMQEDPGLQEEYLYYLERAGTLGDFNGFYTLAYLYTNGNDGVEVDIQKASQYLQRASDTARAQGKRLNDIAGLSQSLGQALQHAAEYGGTRKELEAEAVNGDAEAMYHLALTLTEPVYYNVDNAKRFQTLLRQSAEQGYPPAQLRAALAMNRTAADPVGQEVGFQWLTHAAKAGYAPALYELGVFYLAKRLPHNHHQYSPYRGKVLMEYALNKMAANKDQLYKDKNGEVWVYYHRYGTRAAGLTLQSAEQSRVRIPAVLSSLTLEHSNNPVADIKAWYYQAIEQVLEQDGDLDQLNSLYNALLSDPGAGTVHQEYLNPGCRFTKKYHTLVIVTL